MNIIFNEKGNSKIAIIKSDEVLISSGQDALDLMSDISYWHQCQKMILRKENITEDFFKLSTGLAGEILQKYANYGMKLGIVGDFSGYSSKPLKDFIYESNRGCQLFFLPDENEIIDIMHNL